MSSTIDPIIGFGQNDRKLAVLDVTLSTGAAPQVGSGQVVGLTIVDSVLSYSLNGSGTTVAGGFLSKPSIQGNTIGVSVSAGTQAGALKATVLVMGF